MIGCASQRPPKGPEKLFDPASKRAVKRILITDLVLIPGKLAADVVLSARRGPSGVSNSHTVPMVIVNALALAVAKCLVESGYPALRELDQLRSDYGYEVLGRESISKNVK